MTAITIELEEELAERLAAEAERRHVTVSELLVAETNDAVSPPAPAHGLVLEKVLYPSELYLE